MAALISRLEEQLTDTRSNQIAYKLTIENPGPQAVRLLSVEPRVPLKARLLEITDTSLAESNARRAELLQELDTLLRQYLWVTSSPFRQAWIDGQREAFREIFTAAGIFRLYFQAIFTPRSFNARMRREFRALRYHIGSSVDARDAFSKWMEATKEHESITSLFLAKTEQLARIESRMDENEKRGLTTVETESQFTSTYVFQFSRHWLEPRKYQLAIEASYLEGTSSIPQNVTAATSVQISPYPWCLSLVAILSALMGVLVQLSLGGAPNPLSELGRMAATGQILTAPIVALVFFNAYEYTSLGKSLTMSVSWRSAMLIGALCGLAQDRILAAMKALIGA